MISLIGLGLMFVVLMIVLSVHHRLMMRGVARERRGESICTFVRALDYRRLDTQVIRAVYERLQVEFRFVCPAFPIRPSDDPIGDFRIDPEDYEDVVLEIAQRCGRSLDDYERNPHHGRINSVSDLIEFLCAQPKSRVA